MRMTRKERKEIVRIFAQLVQMKNLSYPTLKALIEQGSMNAVEEMISRHLKVLFGRMLSGRTWRSQFQE